MSERTFHLAAIENAQVTKDRTRIDLTLRAADGPITLTMDDSHLGHFLTCLSPRFELVSAGTFGALLTQGYPAAVR